MRNNRFLKMSAGIMAFATLLCCTACSFAHVGDKKEVLLDGSTAIVEQEKPLPEETVVPDETVYETEQEPKDIVEEVQLSDTKPSEETLPEEPEETENKEVPYEKEVVWEECNEKRYTVGIVNIRADADIHSDIITVFGRGNGVDVVAKSNTGWSKFQYNGADAYVSTHYLTDEFLYSDGNSYDEDIAARYRNEPDFMGMMYIPSQNMKPLELIRPHYHGAMQGIADGSKTGYTRARFYSMDPSMRRVEIGDHNNQNFVNNEYIEVGDKAYINMGNRIMRLTCASNVYTQSLPDYTDDIKHDTNTICTLTCAPGDTRTVTRWTVDSDSDVSFDEFYEMCAKYFASEDCYEYVEPEEPEEPEDTTPDNPEVEETKPTEPDKTQEEKDQEVIDSFNWISANDPSLANAIVLIRSVPSKNGHILQQVPILTKMTVVARAEGSDWVKVVCDGIVGYVEGTRLSKKEVVPEVPEDTTPEIELPEIEIKPAEPEPTVPVDPEKPEVEETVPDETVPEIETPSIEDPVPSETEAQTEPEEVPSENKDTTNTTE